MDFGCLKICKNPKKSVKICKNQTNGHYFFLQYAMHDSAIYIRYNTACCRSLITSKAIFVQFGTKANLYRVLRIFTDFYGFLQIFKWMLGV